MAQDQAPLPDLFTPEAQIAYEHLESQLRAAAQAASVTTPGLTLEAMALCWHASAPMRDGHAGRLEFSDATLSGPALDHPLTGPDAIDAMTEALQAEASERRITPPTRN